MTTAPASDLLSGRERDLDLSFVNGSNTCTADIVFLARQKLTCNKRVHFTFFGFFENAKLYAPPFLVFIGQNIFGYQPIKRGITRHNKALTKPRNRTNIFGKLVFSEIKLEIKNGFFVNYGSAIQNYLSQQEMEKSRQGMQ